MNARTISGRYSIGEEIANSLTHALGVIFSITGMVVLMLSSSDSGNFWRIVSCAVFGITLILLYTASTLYHGVQKPKLKSFMRILDHSTIFLLIAGTYTPFTLVNLRGPWGWSLFGVIWGLALLGIYSSDHLTSSMGWYFCRIVRRHGVGCCCGCKTIACGCRSIRHDATARRRSCLYFRDSLLRLAQTAISPCHLAYFCTGRKHLSLLRSPVLCRPHITLGTCARLPWDTVSNWRSDREIK